MRKAIIVLIIGLIVIFCFLIGFYISKLIGIEDKNEKIIAEITEIEDECTAEYEYYQNTEAVNTAEEKVSPNAKVVVNIYYEQCGHTVSTERGIEPEYINKTKEELEKIYGEYEIKDFSKDRVELYKEATGICNEHYIIKDLDGYVAVYAQDTDEKEILQQVTEISTNFLTLTDIARLQGGIKLYGKENLNKLLEDLE